MPAEVRKNLGSTGTHLQSVFVFMMYILLLAPQKPASLILEIKNDDIVCIFLVSFLHFF
jgi:hypothetical protein